MLYSLSQKFTFINILPTKLFWLKLIKNKQKTMLTNLVPSKIACKRLLELSVVAICKCLP